MIKRNIELAGITVEINSLFNSVMCRDYESENAPDFSVTVSPQDIIDEQTKSKAEYEFEGKPYPGFSPQELERTAVYRKIAVKLPEYDAFVFHGSAIAVGDKAFLFTAKSGTGKTTHTNLWLKNIDGSYIVNGDKPIIRITDGKAFVCGTPWMGKEGLGCNKTVSLEAICILNRGETNTIERVGFGQAMPLILGQSYRPKNSAGMLKTVKLIEKLSSCVKFYSLHCNMDDEAAFVSYRGMCNDEL